MVSARLSFYTPDVAQLVEIPQGREDDTGSTRPVPFWKVGTLDGKREALVACANGHLGYLSDHTITTDGHVHPSLVCSETGCDWHVWGRLLGWTP